MVCSSLFLFFVFAIKMAFISGETDDNRKMGVEIVDDRG
jgi:hypothetical protein